MEYSNSSVALATAMSRFASAVSDDQQEVPRANATPANTRDVTLYTFERGKNGPQTMFLQLWRENAP